MSNDRIGKVFIALVLLTTSGYAQESRHNIDDTLTKMQSQLNLTPDQTNAIKPIIQENMTKRQELRASLENGSADKESIRIQMQQLRDEENQKLSEVLSADQMSQWQNMQNIMRQGHKFRQD